MEIKKSIGERIRARRKAMGLSQTQLAQKTGNDLRTIGAWERGENSPQGDNLQRVAMALQTKPEWLVEGQPEATVVVETGSGKSEAMLALLSQDPAHQVAHQALFNLTRDLAPDELPAFIIAATKAAEEAKRAREMTRKAKEDKG